MMFYRLNAALLSYPDAELRAGLDDITETIAGDPGLSAGERRTLRDFVAQLAGSDPTDAEADYVRTFDMVPEHSLHLTHHLIGEDKNRGPALIDLTADYHRCGYAISAREIPDYLPLMLEFASLLEAPQAAQFLTHWQRVLRQLQANLDAAESPYAALLGLLVERCEPAADAAAPCDKAPRRAVPAAAPTDPCQEAGDFDPPVNWNEPPALHGHCGARPR